MQKDAGKYAGTSHTPGTDPCLSDQYDADTSLGSRSDQTSDEIMSYGWREGDRLPRDESTADERRGCG